MALIKDKETNFGITATYHRIENIRHERTIYVGSYLDKNARDNSKSPLETSQFYLPTPEEITDLGISEDRLKLEGNSPKILAYEYLKTLDDFSDATDDE